MERSRRERKPTARSSALEAMRAAREGGDEARDSRWDMPDEQDVYDEVNEDDYRSMVEKRREREDFVVDDNGFGYYDDGEEHFGKDDDAAKKRKNVAATGAKVKRLISKKDFELADYVRKKVGGVGSGKEYYQSGR